MKNIYALCFIFCFFHGAFSQIIEPCAYHKGILHLEQLYPGYQNVVNETFETAKSSSLLRDDIYTIPVVVHIVWKESAENLPMSQIEEQIAVLNECYRRQNADTTNTRDIFQPIVGDSKIEFVLSDVKYVQTNVLFETNINFLTGETTLPDIVKQSSEGGDDAVDPEHFLNIWVCKLQPISILGTESPLLGYAYPPANLDNWPAGQEAPSAGLDGVVIDYRAFGKDLTFNVPGVGSIAIEGRTPVHEVGHYLGLRHIWGDGNGAIFGIPDCTASDGVDDTPAQGLQSQFDCNTSQNSCTDDNLPDMIENYMDYSAEDCMNSFTNGQIAIMRAVLEGPRNSLLLNVGTHNIANTTTLASVSPNPASDELVIHFKEKNTENFNINIFNNLGENIISTNTNQSTYTLDVSNLASGLYFMSIENNVQKSTHKVIIK